NFYTPVGRLSNMSRTILRATTSAERIFEVLDTRPEVHDAPNAIDSPPLRGHIKFHNVSFAYESGEIVLKNINLEIKPGEKIGLVGPSGAGKTTLVKLILRFYDPTEGKITIDGHDLRELKQESLRRQIGIVLQEPFLFKGSIAENIAYGDPGAPPEKIIEAAKAANIHDFIISLPEAYDTDVGERGHRLSVGEKQRVSIARALLKDPKILILDEATSSVDTATESLIQQALERVMENRTSIVIAHRLSTLRNVDRIVVIDNGRIVEEGPHEELIQRGGLYSYLWKMQTALATLPGV
ncbi:ABC transporter ATP-binding protein, partial [Candidatus Bathyarchaeota archaeon]|nr:ABC transporter ATP-binding protein [Candidatus Bathyarchaeota archaeon]